MAGVRAKYVTVLYRKTAISSSSSTSSGDKKRSVTQRKRQSRQTDSAETAAQSDNDEEDTDNEDYVDAARLNDPVNDFIRSYMIAVAKYWPMFRAADQEMSDLFQSVLTRTTIATNMNRTTLTSAGVPFKEFVVTCRYARSALS